MEPAVAQAFLSAVNRIISNIDNAALIDAIASGSEEQMLAALATGGDIGQQMGDNAALEKALRRTTQSAGAQSADVLSGALRVPVEFNRLHPDVVLYARTQAGELIVGISADVREAVRIVLATGSSGGATTVQQARVIRQIVGLAPNNALAPLHLAEELRAGAFTSSRRLSAVDKAMIRSRLARGTVDEEFITRMQERYAASLRNRRARVIARQETAKSAHYGQRQSWRQAQEQGAIPRDVRRFWIVTPDDRLRDEHAAIPGLNPDGVGLDEPFDTPFGPVLDPPAEIGCRCSVGLLFSRGGAL
jgi:hypothetical protein